MTPSICTLSRLDVMGWRPIHLGVAVSALEESAYVRETGFHPIDRHDLLREKPYSNSTVYRWLKAMDVGSLSTNHLRRIAVALGFRKSRWFESDLTAIGLTPTKQATPYITALAGSHSWPDIVGVEDGNGDTLESRVKVACRFRGITLADLSRKVGTTSVGILRTLRRFHPADASNKRVVQRRIESDRRIVDRLAESLSVPTLIEPGRHTWERVVKSHGE